MSAWLFLGGNGPSQRHPDLIIHQAFHPLSQRFHFVLRCRDGVEDEWDPEFILQEERTTFLER